MKREFGAELLDKVAEALFTHDAYGQVPVRWNDVTPLTRKNYLGFAQAALEAMCTAALLDEQFVVRGVVPWGGREKCPVSSPLNTLEEAQNLRLEWVEKHDTDAVFTIEHRARVWLNTLKYWTQAELDAIDARAKEMADELAKHVK